AQNDSTLLEDLALVIGFPLLLVLVGVGITLLVYHQQTEHSLTDVSKEAPVLEGEMVMVGEMVEPSGELKDEG
ncbi:MAG: hypothetical protein ACPG7K_00375, partial [Poseidonia sp.]